MLSKLRKKILLLIVLLTVVAFGAFHFVGLSKIEKLSLDFTPSGYATADANIREKIHFLNYKFLHTNAFERKVGGWTTFASKSKADKCIDFFKFIDGKIPDWEVSFFKDRLFDKSIVNKGHRIKTELEKKRNREVDIEVLEDASMEEKKSANQVYDHALKETSALEQDMADTMTIVRLFGHCFFNGDVPPLEGELKDIYDRYSSKVTPFFSPELPLANNGDVEPSSQWPFDGIGLIESGNLLDFYYRNMKGSGIVLSTATRHSRDVVRLIHVLRALGNTLPIEVMYRSDLLMRAKHAILLAGTLTREELLGDEMTDQNYLLEALKSVGMDVSDLTDISFPKQKITLVNMRSPLSRIEKNEFSGYDNKLLALFFNSFENVFLFDTDAVPLLPLETLQSLKEYSETGAYFFRDRTLLDRNDWIETNFFAKLMPHQSNKVDMAMGVEPVTAHTLNNPYMKGWRHCQEAGLVMLDRKRHFRSLLTLFPLSIWKEPIKSLIWGDKEMYWLAMSIAGDEDYTLNHHGAASVGEVTSESYLKHYNNTRAFELCSSHPGHVTKDGQLLWINSGYSYCKKNGYARDKERFPFSVFQNLDDVKSLYHNPLKIRHAILPPELPSLRTVNGSPDITSELKFVRDFKERKKDVDEIANTNQISSYGPQKGWIKSRTCSDYQYCAYNAMEAFDGSGALDESGILFEFDDENIRRYDILGAIWGSSLRTSDLKSPSKESEGGEQKEIKAAVVDNNSSGDNLSPENGSSSDSNSSANGLSVVDQNQHVPEAASLKKTDKSVPDNSGRLMDSNLAQNQEKGEGVIGTAQTGQESKVEYDPSQVRERPEKLNNDVKFLLSKLTSTKT